MTIPAAALRAECVELATAIKPYCNLDIELLTNLILHFAQAREAAVWREAADELYVASQPSRIGIIYRLRDLVAKWRQKAKEYEAHAKEGTHEISNDTRT